MNVRLGRWGRLLVGSLLGISVSIGVSARAQVAQQVVDFPVPNGNVEFLRADPAGNRVFIGGRFSRIGPYSGSFAGIDLNSAEWTTRNFPIVAGTVFVAVPDGEGGWYLGGSFDSVGGLARANLARVRADGSVDPDWDPGTRGDVLSMAVDPPRLLIGGTFTEVAGQPRNGLAAVALVGGVLTDWNPNVTFDFSGEFVAKYFGVHSMALFGQQIFVAGSFSAIGGIGRRGLASVDTITGAVDPDWAPEPVGGPSGSSATQSLVVDAAGTRLLVGGEFVEIAGVPRNRLAALDLFTGAAQSWDPDVGCGSVEVIRLAGSSVYIGGSFSTVGGQPRNRLAEVNATTGAVTGWNPGVEAGIFSININALVRDGPTVYLGGRFGTIGGQPRPNLVAIDATTGVPSGWQPHVGGEVTTLTVQGGRIFAGGSFETLGGTARDGLAAFDAASGALLPWSPLVPSINVVNDAAVDGDTVFLAGSFSSIGGVPRDSLAAVDATTGAVRPWNPGSQGSIDHLIISGNEVFVAKERPEGFTFAIGGAGRIQFAALNKITGLASAWNPSIASNGERLSTIVDAGGRIFIGGEFAQASGQTRANFAEVDRTTGAALGLIADADGPVLTQLASDDLLIIGGDFSIFGGQARSSIAALDLATGAVTAWNPTIENSTSNGTVRDIVLDGPDLIVGGRFASVGGVTTGPIARVNRTTGAASGLGIPVFSPPNAQNLEIIGDRLFVAGSRGNLTGLADGRSLQVYDLRPKATTFERPTLAAKGKTRITTSKRRVVLRGIATPADGITRVVFRVGKSPRFRPAKGSLTNWRVPVPLLPGKNKIAVRATGPGGTSRLLKFTITRE